MLGLTLHPSGGGGVQQLIYSLLIVIFKASMCCQKNEIIVYFILINNLLLKTNQHLFNILFIISAQERLVLFPNKRKYIGIGQNVLKNIKYRPKCVEKYQISARMC